MHATESNHECPECGCNRTWLIRTETPFAGHTKIETIECDHCRLIWEERVNDDKPQAADKSTPKPGEPIEAKTLFGSLMARFLRPRHLK